MKRKTRILRKALHFLAILILFTYGLVSFIVILAQNRATLHKEQSRHLMDLCSMADHNIASIMIRCHQELTTILASSAVQGAEETFLKSGDSAALMEYLSDLPLLQTTYVKKALVFSGDTCVLTNDGTSPDCYSVNSELSPEKLGLIADIPTGDYFIALSTASSHSDLLYTVLISPQALYHRAVDESIYSDHWIVMYDTSSGLFLQNISEQAGYMFLTETELSERSEGFSVIAGFIKSKTAGSGTYTYESPGDSNSKLKTGCIAVIPETVSDNGFFTVSVAAYQDNFVSTLMRSLMIFISAAALVTSISMTIFYILHSGARERELDEELRALEKEKELSDKLLENQESLIHHQKLETIGSLTAGVAHEFNNLLSPIMGNSLLILENTPEDNTEVYDNALDIYNASRRAKDLVSKISRLSRKSATSQMQPLSPAGLINGVISMISSTTPKNVLVETKIDTEEKILGDESQLGHMFLNLTINAFQAMEPDGGIVTIAAESDGGFVRFSVSDTGRGIPEAALPHIFDPFFTTKAAGKGTGLGLPIAQQTVSNHQGTITAENRPEGGARFIVAIPVYVSETEDWED